MLLGQWELVTIRLMDELLSPLKRGTILARTVADLIEINFFPLGIKRYNGIHRDLNPNRSGRGGGGGRPLRVRIIQSRPFDRNLANVLTDFLSVFDSSH